MRAACVSILVLGGACSGPVPAAREQALGADRAPRLELAWAAIAERCPCSGPWRNHGAYVSCVAHAATQIKWDGQIDGRDEGALVSRAARSRCGECGGPLAGTFTVTGSLRTARSGAASAQLADGRVLVAGGWGAGKVALASAELYDPSTGTWEPVGDLGTPRVRATATALPDGRVLVAGGYNARADNLPSAEVYDPSTGAFSPTGPMVWGRQLHTATLLGDGTVLLVGGFGGLDDRRRIILDAVRRRFDSAEVYDPATGTFSPTAAMNQRRSRHAAVRLKDGRVLVAGGEGGEGQLASAELYDPASRAWRVVGAMGSPRLLETLTLLGSGEVLAAGGSRSTKNSPLDEYRDTAELFHPADELFGPLIDLQHTRGFHSAIRLATGQVLVVGGYSPTEGWVRPAELWTGAGFAPTGELLIGREAAAVALFDDGTALVAGGDDAAQPFDEAELYHPTCP